MNKEITIYELLGLIKDGQAPNRILYDHYIWSWTGDDYHTILKTEKEQFLITGMYYTWLSEFLNDKVEIIEEDREINKITGDCRYNKNLTFEQHMKHVLHNMKIFQKTFNELIDEINKLKEEK